MMNHRKLFGLYLRSLQPLFDSFKLFPDRCDSSSPGGGNKDMETPYPKIFVSHRPPPSQIKVMGERNASSLGFAPLLHLSPLTHIGD